MQQGQPNQHSDNSENGESGKSKRRGWITVGLAVLYIVGMIGFSNVFFWSLDKDREQGIEKGWSRRTSTIYSSQFPFSCFMATLLIARSGWFRDKSNNGKSNNG